MELREHSFFSFLDERHAADLAGAAAIVRLKDGDMLFEEGDVSDSVYLVLDGAIALSKKDPAGGHPVIARVRADDFFGEFGVLDGGPRSARAAAEGGTVLARIPRDAILRSLHEVPDKAATSLVGHIIGKIRASNERYVEELLRHERMTLIGRMTREILHDFMNPFSVIRLAAETIAEQLHGDPDTRELCRTITEQIDRMAVMADEILEFSLGKTTVRKEPFDIADLLERFEKLYARYLADRRVALSVQRLHKVLAGDQDKLLRALQNLVNNAAQSFAGRPGVIDIAVEDRGRELVLHVRDNGPGIPKAIRDRVFETRVTYGKAKGLGLGMAITKSIIVAHDGAITFDTTPGGTTFHIALPVNP